MFSTLFSTDMKKKKKGFLFLPSNLKGAVPFCLAIQNLLLQQQWAHLIQQITSWVIAGDYLKACFMVVFCLKQYSPLFLHSHHQPPNCYRASFLSRILLKGLVFLSNKRQLRILGYAHKIKLFYVLSHPALCGRSLCLS